MRRLVPIATAGMATKFYIVFFVQECGMKPVYSSSLGIASPISICLFSALVNCLGQYCGLTPSPPYFLETRRRRLELPCKCSEEAVESNGWAGEGHGTQARGGKLTPPLLSTDRIQITLVTKAMDFVLLGIFALLPAGEETRELLVALHLIRSGVANSSRPALRSLMMDHVDKVLLR